MRSMIAAMKELPSIVEIAGCDDYMVVVMDMDCEVVDNEAWDTAEGALESLRKMVASYGRSPGAWTVQLQVDYDIYWSRDVGREI